MSLKDEIKESLQDFSEPMAQAIQNTKDSVKYKIEDTISPENSETKQRKGCLKPILIALAIIIGLSVLSGLFTDNDDTNDNNVTAESTTVNQPFSETSNDNTFSDEKLDLEKIYKDELYAILSSEETPDKEDVKPAYCRLLELYASEYAFKNMAYGHYTDDYSSEEKFDFLLEKRDKLAEEMKQFFTDEEIETLVTYYGIQAYEAYDDGIFDYEKYEVMDGKKPNVQAMWEKYLQELYSNYQ